MGTIIVGHNAGISILPKSQNGETALIQAVRGCHVDCVRALLEAGADIEAKDFVRDVTCRQRIFCHKLYMFAFASLHNVC
jgi:hypothetical protein